MRALLWLAAFLLAGCSGASPGPADGPATDTPAAEPAPDPVTSSAPAPPPPAPTERVDAYEGNLTFEQAAGVVCPVYLETNGRSSAIVIDLTDATKFDFLFEWTPNPSAPTFQGAIFGLNPSGTSVAEENPRVRGRSVVPWTLDAVELEPLDGEWFLHIVGPDCPPKSTPAQTGIAYTQVIHYAGNVTYPA